MTLKNTCNRNEQGSNKEVMKFIYIIYGLIFFYLKKNVKQKEQTSNKEEMRLHMPIQGRFLFEHIK